MKTKLLLAMALLVSSVSVYGASAPFAGRDGRPRVGWAGTWRDVSTKARAAGRRIAENADKSARTTAAGVREQVDRDGLGAVDRAADALLPAGERAAGRLTQALARGVQRGADRLAVAAPAVVDRAAAGLERLGEDGAAHVHQRVSQITRNMGRVANGELFEGQTAANTVGWRPDRTDMVLSSASGAGLIAMLAHNAQLAQARKAAYFRAMFNALRGKYGTARAIAYWSSVVMPFAAGGKYLHRRRSNWMPAFRSK